MTIGNVFSVKKTRGSSDELCQESYLYNIASKIAIHGSQYICTLKSRCTFIYNMINKIISLPGKGCTRGIIK